MADQLGFNFYAKLKFYYFKVRNKITHQILLIPHGLATSLFTVIILLKTRENSCVVNNEKVFLPPRFTQVLIKFRIKGEVPEW